MSLCPSSLDGFGKAIAQIDAECSIVLSRYHEKCAEVKLLESKKAQLQQELEEMNAP